MATTVATKPIADTLLNSKLPPKKLPVNTTPATHNTGATSVTPTSPANPANPTGGTASGATSDADTYTAIIEQTLASWGLSSLNTLVEGLGKTGASQDQITLQIQNSPEYKQRFAGNDERVKNGLGVLDPATYIALEGQYKQILSQLPQGFYDDKNSIDGFIGGDVSPAELSSRVQLANQAWVLAPQAQRDAWNSYYGSSGPGGAVAAFLDTDTAEPLLQQQATAAAIGGAALSQGLSLTGQAKATQAAQQGVTIDQARQTYQQIATRLNSDTSIGGRFGTTFDQGQEEDASLLGNADAMRKQTLLYGEEAAQFSGHGGADDTSGNPGSNY